MCKLLWIKILLEDLKIQMEGTMRLYCDNKSTFFMYNMIGLKSELDKYFIKEKLENCLICMPYIPSHKQLAEILI